MGLFPSKNGTKTTEKDWKFMEKSIFSKIELLKRFGNYLKLGGKKPIIHIFRPNIIKDVGKAFAESTRSTHKKKLSSGDFPIMKYRVLSLGMGKHQENNLNDFI